MAIISMLRRRPLVAALLAFAVLAAAPAAAHDAGDPTTAVASGLAEPWAFVVTPSTNLVRGEPFVARATHPSDVTSAYFGQCDATVSLESLATAFDGCHIIQLSSGVPGLVEYSTLVRPVIAVGSPQRELDCRATDCIMLVADEDWTQIAATPVSYLPDVELSPEFGAPGTTVRLTVDDIRIDRRSSIGTARNREPAEQSAEIVLCPIEVGFGEFACAVIGPATLQGDRAFGEVEVPRSAVADDGTTLTCPVLDCRLGLRIHDPDLRGGFADLVDGFDFVDVAISVTPAASHDGQPVTIDAVLPYRPGSVWITQCAADADLTSFLSARDRCRFPATASHTGELSTTYRPRTTFSPVTGTDIECSVPDSCIIAITPRAFGRDDHIISTPITVLPPPVLRIDPDRVIRHGEMVSIETTALAAAPGATAWVMQCGFFAGFEMACGPVGTTITDFETGRFSGTIEVMRSFVDHERVVECGDNSTCALIVVVADGVRPPSSVVARRIDIAAPD